MIRKSQMDSLSTYVLLTASFFFVALSFGLLFRYRQVSQRINASNDLGHDLWVSLEQRLKKQDERILDIMGRVEVIQARVTTGAVLQSPSPIPTTPPDAPKNIPPQSTPVVTAGPVVTTQRSERAEPPKVTQESPPPLASRDAPVSSPPSVGERVLDETELAVLRILNESPKNTRQLTDTIQKSREHTARLMKRLFEWGFVRRDDSSKPFVYQLTDEGRRRLPGDQ
ncbi:MAG: hypothetical protein JRM88_00435 [Nitrososphaerota archaeon]|nr:hypothetical protein [Nitrososphaerota archaeon]